MKEYDAIAKEFGFLGPEDGLAEIATALRIETLPYLTPQEQEELINCEYDDFWDTHIKLLRQLQARLPAAPSKIMDNTDARLAERRTQDQKFLKETELPLARKRGFARGVMNTMQL